MLWYQRTKLARLYLISKKLFDVRTVNFTYSGNVMFPNVLLNNGDIINSALVELGYLTKSIAVSMPGFSSVL